MPKQDSNWLRFVPTLTEVVPPPVPVAAPEPSTGTNHPPQPTAQVATPEPGNAERAAPSARVVAPVQVPVLPQPPTQAQIDEAVRQTMAHLENNLDKRLQTIAHEVVSRVLADHMQAIKADLQRELQPTVRQMVIEALTPHNGVKTSK